MDRVVDTLRCDGCVDVRDDRDDKDGARPDSITGFGIDDALPLAD